MSVTTITTLKKKEDNERAQLNDLTLNQTSGNSSTMISDTDSSDNTSSDTKLSWKQQKEEQTRLRKKQNELKRVEEEIHTLETRDQEIDALLCDETVFSDVPRLMELNKEKEELNAKLEGLYEKWEELAE